MTTATRSDTKFVVCGPVKGVEPRGEPKGGVQQFWTVSIDVGREHPVRVSFPSHKKPPEGQLVGEPREDFRLIQDALFSRQPVRIAGWLQPRDEGGNYKNGTKVEPWDAQSHEAIGFHEGTPPPAPETSPAGPGASSPAPVANGTAEAVLALGVVINQFGWPTNEDEATNRADLAGRLLRLARRVKP